jgi:pimeloyl-ACP methyl ester carboxylesterase
VALDESVTFASVDLPAAVWRVLDDPPPSSDATIDAGGIPFFVRSWGDAAAPPLLLLHGVTASSRIWWRVGPALATLLGRFVLAPDQVGHGRTGRWPGTACVPFAGNARVVGGLIDAARLARPDLAIVGHSWGGMTVAELPSIGIVPGVSVLLDPPAVPLAEMSAMADDPIEWHYDDLPSAVLAVGGLHPTWAWGDVQGKAEALTQFDPAAVRAVLTENGDWDGGLGALAHPAAATACVRLVRGERASGGLVPEDAARAFAARLGGENVLTIAGGSHAPMRQRVDATVAALARALKPPAV